VDKIEDVDETKNKYLKDEELHQKIEPLYNAVIDIFISYCVKWVKDKNIYDTSKSENFQSSIDLINSSNDYMQDFIDSCLIITNNNDDKIGKDRMREMFLQMYPEKHISTLQVISAMKDHKLVYDKGVRDNNIRGCFIGIKARTDTMDEEETPKDENQIKLEKQAKQIEELLLKLKALEEDNIKLKSIVKMKNVLETEPVVEAVVEAKEIETTTDYMSTADEEEPIVEQEVLIMPKKKLQKKKEKAPVKKISKTKEEEKAFAASFTGEEDEDPEIDENPDDGHIIIW
jgi:hypothetical protein